MTRRTRAIVAIGIAIAGVAGAAAMAHAAVQPDTSAELRATGLVGERADGYLGLVGAAPSAVRAQVNAINIKRRAYYTRLAASRRARIEEVAAATACALFATRILPGQYYQLPDGVWRRREGDQPVLRPHWCA